MTVDILNFCVCVCAIFQIVATYSCGRKTARWPMTLFYNMLDVSAYNAFVMWREIDPTWKQSAPNYKRSFFSGGVRESPCVPLCKIKAVWPTHTSLSASLEKTAGRR